QAQSVDLTGISLPAAASISDAMPDAGQPVGSWTVLFRGQQGQGASLTTPRPFRSSNGEATTYEYQVTAAQPSEKALRFGLSADGVPAGWNVTLPGTLLELAPGSPVTFPVHVAVPFAHVHGLAKSVTLHLKQAGNGTAWATLELGVHFTTVPQPAGHHPSLFLHSADWSKTAELVNPPLGGSTGVMTMNTLADDLADTGKAVEGYSNFLSTSATWTWDICLSPQLALGIDMDLQATGTFSIPVATTRPLTAATFTGKLIHLGPGDSGGPWCFNWGERKQTPLATITGTPQDLASNSPVVLSGTIVADPAGDYVPYADGAQMVLELVLTTNDPAVGGAGGPAIQPGASLTLPIREYHDAAVSAFVDAAPVAAPAFVTSAPSKASPAAGLLTIATVALLAFARRR
ncbi:MAG: hypothetical protein LC620_05725, partial [Halobacteriales archaeon]|nr:hypothetical protein [Halobacteriales archaeon]